MVVGYPGGFGGGQGFGYPPQQQFISPQFQQPFGSGPFVQTQYRATSQQYVLTQQLPGGFGQPQFGGFGGLQQSPFGLPQQQSPYGLQQSPFGLPQQQSPYGLQQQQGGGPQVYVGNLWPVGSYSPQLGNQFIA